MSIISNHLKGEKINDISFCKEKRVLLYNDAERYLKIFDFKLNKVVSKIINPSTNFYQMKIFSLREVTSKKKSKVTHPSNGFIIKDYEGI